MARRGKGTFVVHVDQIENGTWQGELVWAEKNRSRSFRSTLELMKLMDVALASNEEDDFEEEEDEEEI